MSFWGIEELPVKTGDVKEAEHSAFAMAAICIIACLVYSACTGEVSVINLLLILFAVFLGFKSFTFSCLAQVLANQAKLLEQQNNKNFSEDVDCICARCTKNSTGNSI